MLKYNNKEDILKMMQYHRTRNMINLLKYFPDLSPVKDLVVVTSIEDFLNNYDYCSSFTCERNDTLITKSSMVSVEAQELDRDLLDIFKRVKKLDDDGVLVLFNLTHAPSERYERYAGISVGVSVGKGVYSMRLVKDMMVGKYLRELIVMRDTIFLGLILESVI